MRVARFSAEVAVQFGQANVRAGPRIVYNDGVNKSLDYATYQIVRPRWVTPVVAILLLLNCVALLFSAFMFRTGISGDSYAPLIGMLYGAPLLVLELILSVWPTSTFAPSCKRHLGKWRFRVLILISGAAAMLDLAGVACAILLPTTHGSRC
jgi:hypothetical protein